MLQLDGVLKAIYDGQRNDEHWLGGIAYAARNIISSGVVAYTYDISSRGELHFLEIAQAGLPSRGVEQLFDAAQRARPKSLRRALGIRPTAALLSVALGSDFGAEPRIGEAVKACGGSDILAVKGATSSGRGCRLSWALPKSPVVTRSVQAQLRGLAVHLVTAWQLRDGNAQAVDEGLSADGCSAAGESVGFPSARWAVIADFVSCGERYLVVRETSNARVNIRPLTAREREIVMRMAAGATPKAIAYELGLSDSTVRVLMGRARAKLGLETRAALLEALRQK